MKINKKSGVLLDLAAVLMLAAMVVFTGCRGTVGSSGSGNGEITPPSGDVGSFEDTGDNFIKISPPAAGITGKDPTYTLPGMGEEYWKGVFCAGRKVKLSPYKLGKTEITGELWLDVYNWAVGKGYTFATATVWESGNYPMVQVSWRDCIVWCNAYTEKNKGEAECVYRKSKTDNTVLKNAKDEAACDAAYADMEKKGYRLQLKNIFLNRLDIFQHIYIQRRFSIIYS